MSMRLTTRKNSNVSLTKRWRPSTSKQMSKVLPCNLLLICAANLKKRLMKQRQRLSVTQPDLHLTLITWLHHCSCSTSLEKNSLLTSSWWAKHPRKRLPLPTKKKRLSVPRRSKNCSGSAWPPYSTNKSCLFGAASTRLFHSTTKCLWRDKTWSRRLVSLTSRTKNWRLCWINTCKLESIKSYRYPQPKSFVWISELKKIICTLTPDNWR